MPRTVQEILDHADELAQRFEDYEPSAEDERDPEVFAALRRAVLSRSEAEKSIKVAVDQPRRNGYSCTLIGTSGEARTSALRAQAGRLAIVGRYGRFPMH